MLSDCIDEATLATSSLVGDLVYLIQIGKGSLVTVPDEGNPCTRSVIYLFATNPMALLHPGGNRVHYSWLLDCISGFKVLPFTGYLFLKS